MVFCVWFKRELGCSVQKETARRPGGHRDQCGAALDGRGRINSWDVAFFGQGRPVGGETYVCAFFGGRDQRPDRRRA